MNIFTHIQQRSVSFQSGLPTWKIQFEIGLYVGGRPEAVENWLVVVKSCKILESFINVNYTWDIFSFRTVKKKNSDEMKGQ